MSIFSDMKDRRDERRLKRMEKDLQIINARNNLAFNPFTLNKTLVNVSTEKTFTARALENYTWFTASIPLLRSYYKGQKALVTAQYADDDYQFFWAKANNKIRKITTKLPNLVSSKMVDLLIGNGIDITNETFNENNEKDDVATKLAQDTIDEIYKDNDFYNLMTKSIKDESWGGSICWKINIDSDFSKLPIIDEADVRNVEILTKHKRVVGIIFKEFFEKNDGKNKYVLHETYTTDINGDAVIKYELFEMVKDKLEPVSLTTIDETKDYAEKDTHVFVGLKGMLAGFKPNKLPNAEFSDTQWGESDYAGSYSLFDSADEIYSTMVDEVRKGRTKRLIPNTMIPKGPDGMTGQFDDFTMDYEMIEGGDATSSGEENKIVTSQMPSRTLDHLEEWKTILTTICNNVGLSPLTIGVTGLESVSASESSQREREKVSLRTRDAKIKLWSEFLNKFTIQLLKAYKYMVDNGLSSEKDTGVSAVDITNSNTNIIVSFGDYFTVPFEQRLVEFGTAKQNGSISIEEMVEQIYRTDKTEEQKQKEINRIKAQAGMSLSNVDNLLL